MKTLYQRVSLFIFSFTALVASAQVPVYSSYPASDRVIFLDFDGHLVQGTSWNYSIPTISCDGSNLNNDQVTSIYSRIAEDYRPFTVNITTDSTKYWAAPADKRMRVVFTTSSSWYGSAGGVAYVNSFTWGDNTPAFVFTALLNYNTKQIAEAGAHEAGHTLGLRHQSSYDAVCNKTSEYNNGKGTGEIGWAPIMGVGYYQNMTLWNYGANPYGCQSYQDDLSIITSTNNGITFRNDDHSNSPAGAATVNLNNNAFAFDGIIEQPGDMDVIKFKTGSTGKFNIDAKPYSIASGNTGSNIDLQVELLDGSKQVVAVYNSATTLSTSIDTVLNPGTYYLRVQGKGNEYAPNYASLGSYTVEASMAPLATLPLHKLLLKGATETKQHRLDWEIEADEPVVSQTVEVAANGNNFEPLATVGASARSFSYLPTGSSMLYYRVKVAFSNGSTYYSNTIPLRQSGSNGKPSLAGNMIRGTMTISSPSTYQYAILDYSGRMVEKGTLTQGVNTISPRFTANGIYVIQYYNGSEMHTEKFSRQ
jgi:hypothetical protein